MTKRNFLTTLSGPLEQSTQSISWVGHNNQGYNVTMFDASMGLAILSVNWYFILKLDSILENFLLILIKSTTWISKKIQKQQRICIDSIWKFPSFFCFWQCEIFSNLSNCAVNVKTRFYIGNHGLYKMNFHMNWNDFFLLIILLS